MHLVNACRNALVGAGLLGFLNLVISGPAQAITLNFSATLVEGTCSIDLSPSNLPLDPLSLSELKPETLLSIKPFTLMVRDCTAGDPALTPGVTITGPGAENPSGKWLFRNGVSTASGVGVMLIQPGEAPNYSSPAVRTGDRFPLITTAGTPEDQEHIFHAGVACSNAECTATSAGAFSATITFEFNYR